MNPYSQTVKNINMLGNLFVIFCLVELLQIIVKFILWTLVRG